VSANDPAFPTPHFVNANGDARWDEFGLSKRELFAAMAMPPLIQELCGEPDTGCPEIAAACVQMADALLLELAKGAKP
jgi:hypothetical protein